MATTTERILQSSGLEAAVGNIAAREFGLTTDTERPVIGTTTGGPKFVGTESFVSIITAAPAPLALIRRSRMLCFVDTNSAGSSVALDIQAGAQSAGYAIQIFVNGPDTRQAVVTYGVGLVEYIPAGISQEFIWDGAAWNKTRLSWADRYNLGSYIESSLDETASAKNPIIKLWDSDHILDVANYPLLVPKYRAEKIKTWSGAAYVTDHSVTVAASVITGAGTAWTNFVAALAEDAAVHGGYTNYRCVNIAGVDYPVANTNSVAGTVTVTGTPAAGAQTCICYGRRIAGSNTTARTYKDSGRALMSQDGGLRVAGFMRRFHMQGHEHGISASVRLRASAGATLAYSAGSQRMVSLDNVNFNTPLIAVTDDTNGPPSIGPETEPNSSAAYRAIWAGALV